LIPHAPLLAIILPIISAVALYVFKKRVEKYAGWLATIAASLSVLILLSMVTDLTERGPIHFTYAWIRTPSIHLTLGFWVDMISFPIGLIVAVVSVLSCFYSIKYMEGEGGQAGYYASLLLFMAGMIGVIFSANLLQFYLFWELMLVPSYFLIVFWGKSKKRLAIGFKYFIFTHFGSLCMLLGILSIYVFTGTFDLADWFLRENGGLSSSYVVA
jgi:NADH:ubiquinone oxidoreductase subunit 5 (subunit L)/multisubunit Na+/H+ antiporter MnhA subunit